MARMTKKEREAKREREKDREIELLMELQDDHGYMFSDLDKENDRFTMHFRGSRGTRKYSLVPARRLEVTMPDDSWLARWADARLAEKSAKSKSAKSKSAKSKSAKSTKAAQATGGIAKRARTSHTRRGPSDTRPA